MANQELRKLPVTSKRWSVLIHTIGKRTAIDALRGMTVPDLDQETGKIVRRRRTAGIADVLPKDHDQNDQELADKLQQDEAIQRHKEQTARKDAQDFARAEVERLLSHLPHEDEAFIMDYLTSDKP